ncbi:MAG: hypothetical protein MUF70_15765, partial [Myxococcota bacterium]|nr:hypothetical protein [Myxococcota bacterium]
LEDEYVAFLPQVDARHGVSEFGATVASRSSFRSRRVTLAARVGFEPRDSRGDLVYKRRSG